MDTSRGLRLSRPEAIDWNVESGLMAKKADTNREFECEVVRYN